MKDVIEDTSSPPAWMQLISSSRCCGRSPSGSPAEPGGNDLKALMTSGSVICNAMEGSAVGKGPLSDGALGCISASLVMVLEDGFASLSSEQRSRIAAFRLPSSILAETAEARRSSGSL